jgi:hypothetical protein
MLERELKLVAHPVVCIVDAASAVLVPRQDPLRTHHGDNHGGAFDGAAQGVRPVLADARVGRVEEHAVLAEVVPDRVG